jgi:hypothetical protein
MLPFLRSADKRLRFFYPHIYIRGSHGGTIASARSLPGPPAAIHIHWVIQLTRLRRGIDRACLIESSTSLLGGTSPRSPAQLHLGARLRNASYSPGDMLRSGSGGKERDGAGHIVRIPEYST